MEDSNAGAKAFLTVFFGLRKVRTEFMFKKIVLVLKLLRTTFYIIVKTFVYLSFVEASILSNEMLV